MYTLLKRKFDNLIKDEKFADILSGSVFALSARIIATALTLITTIIIARLYGVESVGILAVITSFLMLVTIFTVLGTGTSILRLIPEHITKHSVTSAFRVYRKTQYMVALVSIGTGLAFYFAAGIIADKLFSKPHLTFFFALAAGFVIFKSLMDLNTQAVRGLKLIKTFAVMQVIPALTMLLILLAATLFSKNTGVPVYSQLAAWAVTGVAGIWIMDRAFKNRMRAEDVVQSTPVKEIVSISIPMLMTASMHFFIAQTGIIMLGMFRTASEVGYYSVAVKLATLTTFILQAINSIAAPKFSELFHAGKMEELFHVAKKSSKLIFWTTAPILLFSIVLGKPMLSLFFGEDFTIAYPALVLLVIGQFVNSISGSTGHFMNMTGNEKAFRKKIFFAAVINVVLNLALIPQFGIYGAAFGGMISLGYWNIHTLFFIKSKYGISIGYFQLFKV